MPRHCNDMPSHLVVEALSAMAHLSYPQVNTERQLTAWTEPIHIIIKRDWKHYWFQSRFYGTLAEKGVLIFLITVLMIVFAAIMLIESWYLLSHRKTGIFGQAATERSFRHCSIWGWLLLIWGIVSLILLWSYWFGSNRIGNWLPGWHGNGTGNQLVSVQKTLIS